MKLIDASGAHSHEDIMMYVEEDEVLFAGDLYFTGRIPFVGDADSAAWLVALDSMLDVDPKVVIPGHGPVFADAPRALEGARRRLDGFVRNPPKHALYAAKVLLKYKLLEWQQIRMSDLTAWAQATPYFGMLHERHFGNQEEGEWLQSLADDLVRSGAAVREGDVLHNT